MLHLSIVGFLAMLRWFKAGVAVLVVCIAEFFLGLFRTFPAVSLLNLVPVVLLAIAPSASARRGRVIS